MRRRGAIWVNPLPAFHFRCRLFAEVCFEFFLILYPILVVSKFLFLLFYSKIDGFSFSGVCLSGGALATPLVSRQAHASVPI